jgi:rubrerythrin
VTDFGSALETVGLGAYMTEEDLGRALRYAIADEYEAIQIYSQISESTEDPALRAVIDDIVSEEKKHASQFWDLLSRVDPEEHQAWNRAINENKRLMESQQGGFRPVVMTSEERRRRTRRMQPVSQEERQEVEEARKQMTPFSPRGIAGIEPEAAEGVHGGELGGMRSLHSPNVSAAELQLYLKGVDYPIDKEGLLQTAELNQAPDFVMECLQRMPDRTYDRANIVEEEFGRVK